MKSLLSHVYTLSKYFYFHQLDPWLSNDLFPPITFFNLATFRSVGNNSDIPHLKWSLTTYKLSIIGIIACPPLGCSGSYLRRQIWILKTCKKRRIFVLIAATLIHDNMQIQFISHSLVFIFVWLLTLASGCTIHISLTILQYCWL